MLKEWTNRGKKETTRETRPEVVRNHWFTCQIPGETYLGNGEGGG
jgi:hypothetical protein